MERKKQPTITRSSIEAVYRSIALAVAEICWIKSLLSEIGRSGLQPTLWFDNLGATYLAANLISHARTKHIEIEIHFVRDLVAHELMLVQHISSVDQIVDAMTKALSTIAFHKLCDKLAVTSPISLRGDDNT